MLLIQIKLKRLGMNVRILLSKYILLIEIYLEKNKKNLSYF